MSWWQRWLRQPQSVWVRKALFQVHLWAGVAAALYIFIICVTGSMLVFRPEISRTLSRKPVIVNVTGALLTDEQLKDAAERQNPGYIVTNVFKDRRPNVAAEVWLESPTDSRRRLVDPFRGSDLGPVVNPGMTALSALLDLHDNLLTGETGRLVNGAGGFVLMILAMTGVFIWWPGIKNWMRSLAIHRGVSWKRFVWDLHSAVGFWSCILVFMFAFSGFYLVYQEWFSPVLDRLAEYDGVRFERGYMEDLIAWLPRLHFGRFRGLRPQTTLGLKIFWVVIGLAPAVLSVTGLVMWWNRVVRRTARTNVRESKVSPLASSEMAGGR
jgi:uncharacterized iron-regulated membrane protein